MIPLNPEQRVSEEIWHCYFYTTHIHVFLEGTEIQQMTYTTLSGTALRFVIRGKKCITAFCLMLVPNVFNETGKKKWRRAKFGEDR